MYSETGRITDEYIRYILEAYSAKIIRLCYTYVKNAADAEDLTQDVFVELMQNNVMFEDKDYEKAWLMRTAVNKCKNHLKSCRVTRTVPLEDEYPENDKNLEETDDTVLNAVLKLPEKYRTPLHLYYYSGYSIKEIAAITGDNTSTVGTKLSRGRAALKKILKGEINI